MEKFIDRETEMATLQNEYTRSGSSLVILYGRRRVGKTTLIAEFIKNKKEDGLPQEMTSYPLLSCNPLSHKGLSLFGTRKNEQKASMKK